MIPTNRVVNNQTENARNLAPIFHFPKEIGRRISGVSQMQLNQSHTPYDESSYSV